MTREECFEIVRDYRNPHPWQGGVMLQVAGTNRFYAINFGAGGSDAAHLEPGCDDYLSLTVYAISKEEVLEESGDGGQMEFNEEASGYAGDIRRAVYDALDFLGYPVAASSPASLVPLTRLD